MGRFGAFACLCALIAVGAASAAGSPPPTPTVDTSFGTNGSASIPFPVPSGAGYTDANQSEVFAMGVDGSGRLLVAGTAFAKDSGGHFVGDFCVARLSQSGVLDTSFGTNGVACVTPQADAKQFPQSVAVDPTTGDIVLAGTSLSDTSFNSTAYLVRLTSSGQPDANFGSGGIVAGPAVEVASPTGAVAQSTGKIVLGYATPGGVLTLARYNGGSPDSSFGNNGSVALSISAPYYLQLLALQADDSIDVGGDQSGSPALQHVSAGGAVDSNFGTAGIATTPGITAGYVYAMTLQGTDILLSGSNSTGSAYEAVLARFTSAGAIDTTFGTGGVQTLAAPAGASNLYGGPIFYDSDPGEVAVNATDSDLRICTSTANGGMPSCPLTAQGGVTSGTGVYTPGQIAHVFWGGYDSNDKASVSAANLGTTSGPPASLAKDFKDLDAAITRIYDKATTGKLEGKKLAKAAYELGTVKDELVKANFKDQELFGVRADEVIIRFDTINYGLLLAAEAVGTGHGDTTDLKTVEQEVESLDTFLQDGGEAPTGLHFALIDLKKEIASVLAKAHTGKLKHGALVNAIHHLAAANLKVIDSQFDGPTLFGVKASDVISGFVETDGFLTGAQLDAINSPEQAAHNLEKARAAERKLAKTFKSS